MAKAEKERVDASKWRRPRKNEWMQVEKRFHFDFAGKFFEDSENEYFESYVRDNRLEEYITYHGIVGGEKMKNLFKVYYIDYIKIVGV